MGRGRETQNVMDGVRARRPFISMSPYRQLKIEPAAFRLSGDELQGFEILLALAVRKWRIDANIRIGCELHKIRVGKVQIIASDPRREVIADSQCKVEAVEACKDK